VSRSEALIDLAAIRSNTSKLKAMTQAQLLAVVKADAYGHGLVPSARAALRGGANWLGVAIIDEALELRAHGVTAPILAWLWTPGEEESVRRAIAGGIDLSVNSIWALEMVAAQSRALDTPASVHLKIDTGLSRNGVARDDWRDVLLAAAELVDQIDLRITGIWSHFAYADSPGHATIDRQLVAFEQALAEAVECGVVPSLRHIANSAALLTRPDAHYDMVRPGIALYGLPPVPGNFGLTPAMTLRAELALAKKVAAGEGVSYGHDYVTSSATTLGLVPLGYADGIPRAASSIAPLQLRGERFQINGRVCMDQFVVDLGAIDVQAGEVVTLFGPGIGGEPTATEWADLLGTIDYEIVTRIGPRVRRVFSDDAEDTDLAEFVEDSVG